MTTSERKRHPSYQSVERANVPRTRDTGVVGLHTENLFDEDERVTDGAQLNEVDGKPYHNSGHTDEEYFVATETGHIVDPLKVKDSTDVMGALRPERDEAAAWLAEHELAITPVAEEQHRQDVA